MHNFRIKFSERLTLVICFGLVVAFFLAGCATQNADPKTSVTGVDPSQSMEITSIGLSEESDSINVVVNGVEPLTYTSVKQPLPLGVVLYFPNTRLNASQTDVQSTGNPVTSIHAGQIEAKTNTTRIEILLAADVPYNVVQDGNSLKIQFQKAVSVSKDDSNNAPTQSGTAQQSIETKETQPVQDAPYTSVEPSGAFQGTGVRIGDENRVWVNRIDFLGEKDGRSTLSIETTSPVDYNIQKVSDKLLELRLMKANIAEFRQRPMITTRFESAVNRIMPIQLPSMRDFSLFSIELREPVPYYVEQTGVLLLVHFEASSVPPAPADETNLPAWKKALEETIGSADMVSTYPKEIQATGGSPVTMGAKPAEVTIDSSFSPPSEIPFGTDQATVLTKSVKQYTGEKIALDFFQTDIKNVFRILREVSGKNFAIDEDVSGKVTLTLDKPVPWDQVMDLVLRMNQLGMIVEGDIVRIATLATLKQENDLRKAQIASLQKEKEQIKALEPLETRYIPVSYSDATTEVLPHIESIVTKDRGSVSVDVKNNQIIITDTADKIAQALDITEQIDKVTSQVIIEARVVEVNENYSKELGFQWNLGVGPVTMNTGGSEYTTDVAMNFPAAANNGFTLNYAKIAGTPFTLDAILTALESNGNGKILSAPKIATLNNKKARIKQGQEIGYLERDSAGGSSVKFKDVDLLLEVTPHVTPDNRISMDIVIQKNDVTGFVENTTVPIISTNEAQTQLLVNDGDTIVIGGIIKSTSTRAKDAFPGLHKIPVLGWLFQRNLEEAGSNELLIFMNPKIVQLEQRSTSLN
jgi:type IV pilus assembly protein PilQ